MIEIISAVYVVSAVIIWGALLFGWIKDPYADEDRLLLLAILVPFLPIILPVVAVYNILTRRGRDDS